MPAGGFQERPEALRTVGQHAGTPSLRASRAQPPASMTGWGTDWADEGTGGHCPSRPCACLGHTGLQCGGAPRLALDPRVEATHCWRMGALEVVALRVLIAGLVALERKLGATSSQGSTHAWPDSPAPAPCPTAASESLPESCLCPWYAKSYSNSTRKRRMGGHHPTGTAGPMPRWVVSRASCSTRT